MYTDTDGKVDIVLWCEMGRQVCHRLKDSQASPYCSLGIVLVRLGIAKIDQQSITKELGNIAVKTRDDVCAHLLIRTDNLSEVLRVELPRQGSGLHQITEHHRKLSAFSLGYGRCREWWCDRGWLLLLCRRLWECLARLRGCFDGPCACPRPHQDSALLVRSYTLGIDQFFFEDIQILVIQIEAHLQRSIRHSSLAFEERHDLVEHVVKRHVVAPLTRPRAPSPPAGRRCRSPR